jgi:hypothetical protein
VRTDLLYILSLREAWGGGGILTNHSKHVNTSVHILNDTYTFDSAFQTVGLKWGKKKSYLLGPNVGRGGQSWRVATAVINISPD